MLKGKGSENGGRYTFTDVTPSMLACALFTVGKIFKLFILSYSQRERDISRMIYHTHTSSSPTYSYIAIQIHLWVFQVLQHCLVFFLLIFYGIPYIVFTQHERQGNMGILSFSTKTGFISRQIKLTLHDKKNARFPSYIWYFSFSHVWCLVRMMSALQLLQL